MWITQGLKGILLISEILIKPDTGYSNKAKKCTLLNLTVLYKPKVEDAKAITQKR